MRVAPCFNPAHQHARPEESMEKLPDLFHAMYTTAMQINPAAVIELCPCGTSLSFSISLHNQAPASDPESSWQVRLKGKTLKALMGPSAPFAGDHVELSDHGDDFASTVGIGAIVATKFTWPKDPKPKDSFLLTPERERWRHWIGLYNERLSQGAIVASYTISVSISPRRMSSRSPGATTTRSTRRMEGGGTAGLPTGSYRLRDYFNGRDLGEVRRRTLCSWSSSIFC